MINRPALACAAPLKIFAAAGASADGFEINPSSPQSPDPKQLRASSFIDIDAAAFAAPVMPPDDFLEWLRWLAAFTGADDVDVSADPGRAFSKREVKTLLQRVEKAVVTKRIEQAIADTSEREHYFISADK
eukprot:tig00020927_g16006.t1